MTYSDSMIQVIDQAGRVTPHLPLIRSPPLPAHHFFMATLFISTFRLSV